MSWVPNKASFGRAALTALLVSAAAPVAADVLVVRATGPSAKSYPAGRSLPDNARIALRPGDTLVVLGSGGTRTFRGPGTFSPSGPVQAGQRLVSANGNRRARIGAVRNAGVVPRSPTLWHVDVSQSATVCVTDPNHVMLWRPTSADTVTLTIAQTDGEAKTVEWPAGQATLAWPGAVAAGTEYRLQMAGEAAPTRLTFKPLETLPTDLPSVAEALIGNGCQEQLDLLVETAPAETASAAE